MSRVSKLSFTLFLLLTLPFLETKCEGLIVKSLTFENQINPTGTDIINPHLSWIMESKNKGEKQTAYQILVASSPDLLAKDKGDLWNSDKQLSEQSVLVKYVGKPLASGMHCFWKVRVWNRDNKVSAWSLPAQWSMGLLKPDDWKAKWIGIDKTFPGEDDKSEIRKLAARYLRKEFKVSKTIKSATAYISGLGL